MTASAPKTETPALAADPALRGWLPRRAEWRRLSGGRTNRLWHVMADGAALVVKLYDRDAATPLFPNDAQAEAAVLRWLDGMGLAPVLIAEVDTAQGPCVIYRHVPGVQGAVPPDAMGRALARLHRRPPMPGLRPVSSGGQSILRQGDQILAACRTPGDIARLRPVVEDHPAPAPVFLHGDPVPANAIATQTGICLIDWQCPALGDPVEDLAIYLSPAMQFLYGAGPLSLADEHAFLTGYGDDRAVARLRGLAPAFHWRMAAYCQWRAERSGADTRDKEALQLELAALRATAQPSR